MNYCKNCGEKIRSDADICVNCGCSTSHSDILEYCTECGQQVIDYSGKCSKCGHSFNNK